ncbi:MAG: hypothetical protein J0H82_07320 [Alphaproteobacteria bacterium]|nr:hypothetical protein [Alphaproteobacteria bacterium]
MTIVFGACGGVVPPGPEPYTQALRRYPDVGEVDRYLDETCFVAVGHKARTRQRRSNRRPMVCADGRHMLALEGWLANRDELSAALGLAAVTDDAIVAQVLLRWGSDGLLRLHGDFAIAWWDAVERRLLLATDRTGGRALFFHEAPGRIFFANIVSPLFAHPRVPRELDPEMVARAAFTASLDWEKTCFRGIRQLLPGQLLDWSAATGARISRYWRLDPGRRVRFRRDDDYVEAARDLLDLVVGEAMPHDGLLASMLSGGLDSGGIAATAARLAGSRPIHTFTVRPDPASPLPACGPGHIQDEWAHAQATARLHPTIVAHAVPASLESFEETTRSGFHWAGRPPIHLLPATWLRGAWTQARSLGAASIFVGLSGNATLSASALPNSLRPKWRDMPEALYAAALAASQDMPVLPHLLAFTPQWLRDLRARLPHGAPIWRRHTALREAAAQAIDMDGIWRSFHAGDSAASWRRRARLRLMERTAVARTMSTCQHFRDGIERRDPLGDVRLAEFCLAIPPDQFTRLGHDRFLARRVLSDRLPSEVLAERRSGVQIAEWFDWASRRRDWLAAELDGIEASALGRETIDVPRLRSILADWPADANTAEPRYGELMNLLGRGVAIGSFIRWAEGSNI